MTLRKVLLNVILPLAVVIGAVIAVGQLLATRPETPTMKPPELGQFVTIEVASAHTEPVHVRSVGRVKPAREVVLQPEITGRIVLADPRLTPGGLLPAGAVAVTLDARAYRLVVAQQQANVAKARVDLQVESGRKVVAEREWSLLESEVAASADGKALALREPYQRLAAVQVAGAEAALQRARLDVERATLIVPFNAMVREESVELGLLASPQTPLAKIVGTDAFWAEVTIPLDELGRIAIPGLAGVAEGEGSLVRVTQVGGGVTKEGRVLKLLNELDPLGAQARLLIEVDDPLGLKTEPRGLPLFLGAFVDVEIVGTAFESVVSVPRKGIRDGTSAWVLSPEGTLDIRAITIVWRERDEVYITSGVKAGERVITSRLSAPVQGMRLEVAATPATAESAAPRKRPPPEGAGGGKLAVPR